jgi:hypothetical protein
MPYARNDIEAPQKRAIINYYNNYNQKQSASTTPHIFNISEYAKKVSGHLGGLYTSVLLIRYGGVHG